MWHNVLLMCDVNVVTRECNALWGKPERVIEVYCRFSSTVEDGALSLILRKTRSFAQYQDSVTGERIEVYVNCCNYK